MRNVIKLLQLAGEPLSIVNMGRCIKSMPTRVGQQEESDYQSQSYCAYLIKMIKARQHTLTPELWSDLTFATEFVFEEWPALDERPRSSLQMTWSGMASKFLFHPWNRIFSGGKFTISPELTTHKNALIIADFPLLEYGFETARLMQLILKLTFQRGWLRRNLADSPNPVFLWQDEFQYFVTRRDNFFQQTCRSSRVAVVCLTQNILNLSEQLGEEHPGSKTKSFLGNLGLKIFLQQNDVETCKYAADLIGKEYRYLDSYNAGGDPSRPHASVGGSQQLVHIIEPIEFSRLTKPDSNNPYAAAIVYQSGKHFHATKTERNPKGRNFLRVLFSREI
jgi:TraM recognition site of TraD and TraG